jgi:hypothetical protein
MRVRAQFRPPVLSAELSTFLNCDLTLIYLLLWARPKAQKEVVGLETCEKQGVNMNLAGVFIA